MIPSSHTRVKICCISSIEEARLAIELGADAIGLVSAMPSGPGVIGEDRIRSIAHSIPAGTRKFLLTSLTAADEIIAQQRRCDVGTLQLVDAVPHDDLRQVRSALPDVSLVQVVHVTGPEAIDAALAVVPLVDMLLLDSGNPRAAVRELGGTGRVHNWDISAEIVRRSTAPVFLAGGLHPGNVAEAVRRVRPYGVDVCSGVRRQRKLRADLVAAFITAAHAA